MILLPSHGRAGILWGDLESSGAVLLPGSTENTQKPRGHVTALPSHILLSIIEGSSPYCMSIYFLFHFADTSVWR
jgi:hypothetical protein